MTNPAATCNRCGRSVGQFEFLINGHCPGCYEPDIITRKITEVFCGPTPRCQCCGQRSAQVVWRQAFQMLLCPQCPAVPARPELDPKQVEADYQRDHEDNWRGD
jgi:hypothetical protein